MEPITVISNRRRRLADCENGQTLSWKNDETIIIKPHKASLVDGSLWKVDLKTMYTNTDEVGCPITNQEVLRDNDLPAFSSTHKITGGIFEFIKAAYSEETYSLRIKLSTAAGDIYKIVEIIEVKID